MKKGWKIAITVFISILVLILILLLVVIIINRGLPPYSPYCLFDFGGKLTDISCESQADCNLDSINLPCGDNKTCLFEDVNAFCNLSISKCTLFNTRNNRWCIDAGGQEWEGLP
jgi:hypothetical protein